MTTLFLFKNMTYRSILRDLIFTFLMSSLRGGLHIFCGTSLRCNSLRWNGAPERRSRAPAKRGSGSGGDARPRLWYVGRPHPATGSHLPLEGHRFVLRGRAPERCPRGRAKRGSAAAGMPDRAHGTLGRCIPLRVAPSSGRHCSALRGRISRRCTLPCT